MKVTVANNCKEFPGYAEYYVIVSEADDTVAEAIANALLKIKNEYHSTEAAILIQDSKLYLDKFDFYKPSVDTVFVPALIFDRSEISLIWTNDILTAPIVSVNESKILLLKHFYEVFLLESSQIAYHALSHLPVTIGDDDCMNGSTLNAFLFSDSRDFFPTQLPDSIFRCKAELVASGFKNTAKFNIDEVYRP